VAIADVEAINPVTRTVTAGGREFVGDHLVVSLGADYASDVVTGLQDHGTTFATLAGAQLLHSRIAAITKGRILVVTAAPLYRCPAAPYESALLIDAALRQRGVRSGVEVILHSAEPAPMAVAGTNVSAAVTEMLAARGIDYRSSHQISAVEPNRAEFVDGASEPFDLLVYMPPIRSPKVVTASSLASESGWIEVDRATLATSFPGVYAIGDNTQIPLSIGKPLPRAGVFAHAQALVVANNIAAVIEDRPSAARFDGHGGCFIETGFAKAAYGSGDFFAEPSPAITMKPPSRRLHWGKVGFEFNVLRRWL
jgi:sulfide:quinone oxidoreductase